MAAARVGAAGTTPLPADADLVPRLRRGDVDAFAALLDAWSGGMLRLARAYVASDEAAEDVIQETWLAVIRAIHGFEARSSLRTWVYRILVNIAKNHGVKDKRTVPWSSLEVHERVPTVDPDRFQGPDEPYPGHWQAPPEAWPTPENAVVAREVRRTIEEALADLPGRQRVVITLRDVDGYSSDEVCSILDISPANQRVLLHRARATVRARLADYLSTVPSTMKGVRP